MPYLLNSSIYATQYVRVWKRREWDQWFQYPSNIDAKFCIAPWLGPQLNCFIHPLQCQYLLCQCNVNSFRGHFLCLPLINMTATGESVCIPIKFFEKHIRTHIICWWCLLCFLFSSSILFYSIRLNDLLPNFRYIFVMWVLSITSN